MLGVFLLPQTIQVRSNLLRVPAPGVQTNAKTGTAGTATVPVLRGASRRVAEEPGKGGQLLWNGGV